MKTFALITTMAMMGLQVFAADEANNATTMDCSTAPTCTKTQKGIQCCGDVWLNIDTVTLEAANGNPLAQFTIAYLTDNGVDIPQDTDKAADMYAKALPGLTKAAEAGHPGACKALAHMYREGKGVDKDSAMADKYDALCKQNCKNKAGKCKGNADQSGNQSASTM